MASSILSGAEEEDTEYSDEEEEKVYLIGGPPILAGVAGITFLLSLWRLIDDPSYSFLSEKGFDLIMNYVVPIVIIVLAMLMVVCMVNGQTPGSEVVPPGNLTKVVVLFILYVVFAVGSYSLQAFIPFVTGSFFGTSACYFLAFILFAVNPMRNPMLRNPPTFDPSTTSLSFYLFLVPAGFGLLNAGCYLIFNVAAGLSRLSAAKLTASIGFVFIQIIGHKNYPGFSRSEYVCYLTGSLGLYVFSFTGVCLWAEEAIRDQSAFFNVTVS